VIRGVKLNQQFYTISVRFKKFVVVGLIATAVHYLCLNAFVLIWSDTLVWKLNLFAAAFGIMASYLGNRHFVFLSGNPALPESVRFLFSYILVGLVHTVLMYVMVDSLRFALSIGFIFATSVQVFLSYTANRMYVFYRA
jgi:putative flippase GtrA